MINLGIVGLIQSRKATMCLIILSISSVALFTKHLDSISFAAIVSTIAVIWNASHVFQQVNSDKSSVK